MEGPPTFVAGSGVPRGGVEGDEADSSLLAALARRNDKDFVFYARAWCAGACRIVTPWSLWGLGYVTALNLFAAEIV